MKIYTVTFESNVYQNLVPEDLSIWKSDILKFDSTSKAGSWPQPSFRIQNPKLKVGDFFGVGPGSLGLGLKASGNEELLEVLERSGELLPTIPTSLGVFILNVTECSDCLDHDSVEWIYGEESGKPIRIAKYAFVKDLVPESTIFKIPEMARAKILVHDGFGDAEDSFIFCVKRFGLKGIRFDEIWSEN